MADVAHRKLGVALGVGQKLVQGRWLVLAHNPDLCGTAMPEQAHLAIREALHIAVARAGHPYRQFTAVQFETVPNRSKRASVIPPNLRSSPQDRSGSLVDGTTEANWGWRRRDGGHVLRT
jgi:hypothetical protein